MSIGYFSDEYCDDLTGYMKKNPPVAPYYKKIKNAIQRNAIHFQLPLHGYILPVKGDEVVVDTTILRPPYPVTVIEFHEDGHQLAQGQSPSTKRLVLAVDQEDSVIIYPAYYADNMDKWIPPLIYWRFEYGKSFPLSRTNPKSMTEEEGLSYGEVIPNRFTSGQTPFTLEEYAAMEIRNVGQEISVYIDFCMALAEYETEFSDQHPDRQQQKLRRLRGKSPLFTYKVIKITGKRKISQSSRGGTHASPVAHLRRGHWRQYKSGKVAWVSAAMINGTDGMVVKDYVMEKRT
jgi:hypothetical protein